MIGVLVEAFLGRLFFGRPGERIYMAWVNRCPTCLLRGSGHS